ncbi:MAG: hypothetical protein KatS3mg081_0578 [Gemmatimonadales bacterium]|nr:hypothetical protein HRbin33_02228 [bacterium HR33]GIW51223.1 MAG: hypothetical protein KatS3mg081_0578 [Gemmatimonadales bacterium]
MRASTFLDPVVLARIDDLSLVARTVVDGFINGLHRSPYLGRSMDFAEHRAYMPGDDIRRIDWRVYGRSDRFFVKEFEADTNANFTVILDVSRSMDYSSGGLTKLDYGRYLAASLIYFSRQQRDRVGFVAFDSEIRVLIPPSAKHLELILHAIDSLTPGEAGSLSGPLFRVAEGVRRRSILLLISDLYEEPENVVRAAGRLKGKGNDVIVFQVLDPAEISFPFQDPADFQDLETGERLAVKPAELAERYRSAMRDHLAAVSRSLLENRIDYCLFDTSRPLDFALFEYLSRRERLSRVR